MFVYSSFFCQQPPDLLPKNSNHAKTRQKYAKCGGGGGELFLAGKTRNPFMTYSEFFSFRFSPASDP